MSGGSSSICTRICTNSASARRLRARSSGLSPSRMSGRGCFFWNSSVNFFSVRLLGWRFSNHAGGAEVFLKSFALVDLAVLDVECCAGRRGMNVFLASVL